MSYFYDTSAIYEYMIDNPDVASYFEEPHEGKVSLLVIMESYFMLLKKAGENIAEEALKMLFPLMVIPTKTIIRKAMKFRLENEKRGFSYADALGYTYAMERNMRFLTCDNAFKGLPNTVFVR
ncbi:PIN domain-containing protein [Candidatus Woesearchaeota archaeon]|nr:PIN domain-containing protein [Candidatus Woesearchaeota archaeon]